MLIKTNFCKGRKLKTNPSLNSHLCPPSPKSLSDHAGVLSGSSPILNHCRSIRVPITDSSHIKLKASLHYRLYLSTQVELNPGQTRGRPGLSFDFSTMCSNPRRFRPIPSKPSLSCPVAISTLVEKFQLCSGARLSSTRGETNIRVNAESKILKISRFLWCEKVFR